MPDDLLDVQQVAKLLKVNPRTVLRMTERGELAAVKVARRWRYHLRDLNKYLRSQEQAKHSDEKSWLTDAGQMPLPSPSQRMYSSGLLEGNGGRRELQLEAKRQMLEIAKQRLELQRQLLDLETQRIDYAVRAAQEMVSELPPEANPVEKAEFYQRVIDDLLRQGDAALPTR